MSAPSSRLAAFRLEDLGLAGWNLVSIPTGAALGGSWMSSGSAPLLGLVEVLAIFGVIVALATRTPDAPPLQPEGFHSWVLAGPLIGAIGLVGSNASERLGLNLEVLGIAAFVAVLVAFIAADRLPVLPEFQRRLAVAPFILVSAGFFSDFVASLLDGLDLPTLARAVFDGSSAPPELAGVASLLTFALLAAAAVFYAMLVMAPRELAAPEPRPRVWLLRFGLFVASAVLGAGGWLLV